MKENINTVYLPSQQVTEVFYAKQLMGMMDEPGSV